MLSIIPLAKDAMHVYVGVAALLVCAAAGCGLRYPVREGIPVMLVEEAEKPAR